jgi:ribosomal protein L19
MSIHPVMQRLADKLKRTDLPEFVPGDQIRVQVKIKEGDKERLQAFEGLVIAINRGAQGTFTVRKMSFGQGVESSTKLRRFAATAFAVPSCSTSAHSVARPPVSKKSTALPARSAPSVVQLSLRKPPGPSGQGFFFVIRLLFLILGAWPGPPLFIPQTKTRLRGPSFADGSTKRPHASMAQCVSLVLTR